MGKWKKIFLPFSVLGFGAVAAAVYQLRSDADSFDGVYNTLRPRLFSMTSEDAEGAHRAAVLAARYGIVPVQQEPDQESLRVSIFGRSFPNPIGLAAGFDKHAEAIPGMLSTGLGFVEIGSVTPQPQEGNPRPRVFRMTEDRAVINRYGFNSEGLERVRSRLAAYRNASPFYYPFSYSGAKGIVGVNLGKNKTSEGHSDYVTGLRELATYADYVVVNVSSPNTAGLRSLQRREQLQQLIGAVIDERNILTPDLQRKVPVLVKIAPDLSADELKDIAEVALQTKVDGVIISNTTVSRPSSLKNKFARETGGLSGAPLFDRSTQVLSDFYLLTSGKVPLIGVGGVSSGREAYEKIRAGASLVQLYSAFIYEGPGLTRKIKRELVDLLKQDGFSSVSQAVGSAHRKKKPQEEEKKPSVGVNVTPAVEKKKPVTLIDVLFN